MDTLVEPPRPTAIITFGPMLEDACRGAGFKHVIDATYPNNILDRHGAVRGEVDWFNQFVILIPKGGEALRDSVAINLGDERCSWCYFPDDKDALPHTIQSASRLWSDEIATIDDVPEPGPVEAYTTGFDRLDEHGLRITLPCFMPVIGPYGSGKSIFLRQLLVNLWKLHGWKFLLTSFEERVKPRFQRDLRRHMIALPMDVWTDADVARADAQIRQSAVFLRRKRNVVLDLERLLDRIEFAVRVYGLKVIAIDPVNEIDHQIPKGENKTDYMGRFIMRLKMLADDYNLLMICCAHPPKDGVEKRLSRTGVLTLNDGADCYSEDTEVLTDRGWLTHEQVTICDRVACFDLESDTCRWELPLRKVVYDYEGTMAHFSAPSMDVLVTPHHKMVVKPRWSEPVGGDGLTGRPRRWPKGQWQFCEAQRLPTSKFTMPLAREMPGGDEPETMGIGPGYPMVPFLKFLGWYLAEGYWAGVSIGICQAPGAVQSAMAGCMRDDLGLPFSETMQTYDNAAYQPTWKARVAKREAPDIVEWMRENCGRDSGTKRIPDFVWTLSARLQRVLLEAFIDGDGYRPPTRRGCAATTTSPHLRDGLQRIAVLCGVPCSVSRQIVAPHHASRWQLNFGDPGRRDLSLVTTRHLSWIPYKGKVWCLTVPTGAFVTRRNGRVAFQGNTAHWGNKADLGFCLWRNLDGPTYLHGDKMKDHETMGKPFLAEMLYDQRTNGFSIGRMGYDILAGGMSS